MEQRPSQPLPPLRRVSRSIAKFWFHSHFRQAAFRKLFDIAGSIFRAAVDDNRCVDTLPQPLQVTPGAQFHFVTGRLAQRALQEVLAELAPRIALRYSIAVMPITVAALMTARWLLRHLVIPPETTTVVLPGYLAEDRAAIEAALGVPVVCGPRDLRQLPEFFGASSAGDDVLREHDIRIIAEINHAPRLDLELLLAQAQQLVADGADVVDIGCNPGSRWRGIGAAFSRLTDAGIVTSVDTLDPWEAAEACRCGASLVLSVNSSNREAAEDWGTEVVVIPDSPGDEESFDETIDFLASRAVPLRLDPILEPIGI
jgi:hypothetical protein